MPTLLQKGKSSSVRQTPRLIERQTEREELIESLLPLVKHIVARMSMYLPSHVHKDELSSAGILGLIDAVDRYDSKKGSGLKAYCAVRIKGAILDELRRLDWVPRSVHRDAKRMAEAQDRAAQRLGREPFEEEVREELGISKKQFDHLVERVKPSTFFSLQEPAFGSDEADAVLQEEVVADNNALDASQQLLRQEDRDLLREVLGRMPRPHQQVLTLYYMEGLRLKEIAEVMHLTESRVSQIHTLAMSRLQVAFQRERVK
jgi:RNA polymerase sigma factor FliA